MKEPVSVSRVVHFTSLGSAPQDGVQEYPSLCRAAVVTEVVDLAAGVVSLAVLNPEGMQFARNIAFDYERESLNGSATPGTWHWPERTVAPLVKE